MNPPTTPSSDNGEPYELSDVCPFVVVFAVDDDLVVALVFVELDGVVAADVDGLDVFDREEDVSELLVVLLVLLCCLGDAATGDDRELETLRWRVVVASEDLMLASSTVRGSVNELPATERETSFAGLIEDEGE